MGQRNGPRPIPSLLEYKTIRLRDRYSTLDSDRLDRTSEASEKGQKGGLNANGKPASASYPKLPSSLASYGGLHSFSQMAQFLPTICNQNKKGRPPPLLPLSWPGLSSGQTSQECLTVRPFYRSSMPASFLSASSNLINSSSTVPFTDTGYLFHNHQIGAKSSPVLQCIGKSGLELPKPTVKSEPACTKLTIEKLPPIGRSHCTLHSTNCSCVHTKNGPRQKNSSEGKPNVKKDRTDVKRKPNTVVGRRKLKAGEPKGPKSIKKAEKKRSLKTKQRQKREPPVEVKKSISPDEQKQQMSPNRPLQTDSYEDEEEGISSYERRNRIHARPSHRSNTSNNDDEVHCDQDECGEEENDLDYYHRNTSILHPAPGSLSPITKPKAHKRGTSLLEDLGERPDDNMGWAKDGFLEDSALRQALLLRNRALYNTSSNNTASVTSNNTAAVWNSVPCENDQLETKDEVVGEAKEILKSLEVCAEKSNEETQGESIHKCKDTDENKLGRAHHIHVRSVTWQDVSPHLGQKKATLTRVGIVSKHRNGKLNPQASRRLKKNRIQKHRDHKNRISTLTKANLTDQGSAQLCIQNLPPTQLLESQDLAISCGARTSKCLGTMSRKKATDMPDVLPDTTLLFTSNNPKFIKVFSLPTAHKTGFPVSEQTGKEKNFEGYIAGTKVKQRPF